MTSLCLEIIINHVLLCAASCIVIFFFTCRLSVKHLKPLSMPFSIKQELLRHATVPIIPCRTIITLSTRSYINCGYTFFIRLLVCVCWERGRPFNKLLITLYYTLSTRSYINCGCTFFIRLLVCVCWDGGRPFNKLLITLYCISYSTGFAIILLSKIRVVL